MTNTLHTSLIPVSPETLYRSLTHQQHKIYFLYGEETIFPFCMLLISKAIGRGFPLAVVDGCNRFNVHSIIRYAQQQRINPDLLLNRVFLSRGFTCYQMEAAINRLPAFLRQLQSHAGIVLGLLDTFYDEQAPFREVEQMLSRIIDNLHAMKASGLSVLLCNIEWNVLPKERNVLLQRLKEGVDEIYRLRFDGDRSFQLFLEQSNGNRFVKED